MIAHYAGVISDTSDSRLSSDAVPALFSFSLNRSTRKVYTGDYFQFRQGTTIKEYPSESIDSNQTAYLVKIYDQKAMHGVPVRDAVQLDESKQPEIVEQNGYLRAVFDQNEYLDLEQQDVAQAIGESFTITSIGDGGDFPRPMIGIWGSGGDRITVEPSDQITRFTFNNDRGTILDSDGKVTQCISGYDSTQNNHQVLTINTGTNSGHITRTAQNPSLDSISIGREDQRLYKGDFSEATMHLGNLTELGNQQLFTTIRDYYGY